MESKNMTETRSADLMSRYGLVLESVLATVEPLPATSMRLRCREDQCSVAALAGHIARVHSTAANWIGSVLAGEPLPPLTMADIDRLNAEHAIRNDELSREEVLAR